MKKNEKFEYFTEKEIEDFKKSSILFPYILEDRQKRPIEVYRVISVEGMGKNGGIPTKIEIEFHSRNGKPQKLLTYNIVKEEYL